METATAIKYPETSPAEARFVSWGHWGISFWTGDRNTQATWRAIAEIKFPVGPCGPMDGFLGSPERRGYEDACRAWTARGELPAGAHCPIDSAWLYDPAHPGAIFDVGGKGWTSAIHEGTRWIYPNGLRRCDAHYAHRERPLVGQCTNAATHRAPSEGRAVDDGPWVYSCAAHAAANPWEHWTPLLHGES